MDPEQIANSNNAQNNTAQPMQPAQGMQSSQFGQQMQGAQNGQNMQQTPNGASMQGGQNSQPIQSGQNMQTAQPMSSTQNGQPMSPMQNAVANSANVAGSKKSWPLIVTWVVFGVLGVLLLIAGPLILTSRHGYRNMYDQLAAIANMYTIMKWVAILAIPGLAGVIASIYFAMKKFPQSLRTIQVLAAGISLSLIWTFASLIGMLGGISWDAMSGVLLVLLLVAPIALVVLKRMEKNGKTLKIAEHTNMVISYVLMGGAGVALILSIKAVTQAV